MALLQVTQENFQKDVLENSMPVLVDFWAPWCGPCRMIAPFVEKIAGEFEGRAAVAKVDVDECRDIAMTYGISSVPTLLVFKDGQVVNKHIGAAAYPMLKKMLESAL